jgi:hypothetical protein
VGLGEDPEAWNSGLNESNVVHLNSHRGPMVRCYCWPKFWRFAWRTTQTPTVLLA